MMHYGHELQCLNACVTLGCYTSEARAMLDRVNEKTPCTGIHNELSEKEKKSSPDQEEKVLIAKS
jgi:hypothetical protein